MCLSMFSAWLAYTRRGPAGAAVRMLGDPGTGDLPLNTPFIHSFMHSSPWNASVPMVDAGSLAMRKLARQALPFFATL